MTATTVDCLGLACPIPVVRLARAVAAVEVGGDRAGTLAGPAGQGARRSRRGQGGGHGESQSAGPAGHQHLHRDTSS